MLAGCGGSESKTTDTTSDHFATLTGKQAFVERYVNFRRHYEDLEFDISYLDGGGAMVPGPNGWDIRILAKVPEESLDEWTSELASTEAPEVSWVLSIPNAPSTLDSFQWYAEGSRIVGVSRGDRSVLYRNHMN